MATYTADVSWTLKSNEDFASGRYSRGHTVDFDGGLTIPASASPHVVGKWAVKEAVDPEEMLVASLACCHMLWYLHLCAEAGVTVVAYRDKPTGTMVEDAREGGRFTEVELRLRARDQRERIANSR